MARRRVPVRYGTLLLAILLTYVLVPYLEGTGLRGYAVNVLFALVQVAAVNTAVDRPRTFRTALALLVVSQALLWLWFGTGREPAKIAALLGWCVFDGYVIFILLANLLRSREVTADTVLGGISIYLLLGFAWSAIYVLLESLQPGSFRGLGQGSQWPEFFYFSFVTLTTLGYGDIVPVTTLARTISTLESVFGVLYLAVLISRLVGLHVSQSRPGGGPES